MAKTECHIIMTSRKEQAIEEAIRDLPLEKTIIPFDIGQVNADISHHLLNVVKSKPYSKWSAELQREVIDYLVSRAKGVFRWADLQIRALAGQVREKDVRRALSRLPQGLEATYERMLKKIDDDDKFEEAYAIFRWIAFSTTRLNLAAISELAAFEIDDPECLPESDDFSINFSTRNRFDEPTEMQSLLSSLVIIPDGDYPYQTFPSFAHSTVLEYLMSPRVSPTKFRLDRMDATWFILKSSWAYITHYDAATQRSKFKPYPLLDDGTLLVDAAGAGEYRTVKLLLDMRPIEENWWCLDKALRRASSKPLDVFKPYQSIIEGGHNTAVLIELLEVGAHLNGADLSGNAAIHLASIHGHIDIVTFLAERQGLLLNDTNTKGETPLLLASKYSHAAVVALLLGLSGSISHRGDEEGRTPLSWAAMSGNKTLFDLIHRDQNVDVSKADCRGRTPLIWASMAGQKDSIKSLLKDPRVEPDVRDHLGRTAVSWAAFGGHYHLLEALWLDTCVTRYPCDYEGRGLLSYACDQGHTSLVRQLLSTLDLDINRPDYYQRTPLIWARLRGHSDVEKLLLNDPRVLDLAPETTTALVTASLQLPDEYIWNNPMTPLDCKKATGQMDASNAIPSEEMSISRISTVDGVSSEIWSLESSPDECGSAKIFQTYQWGAVITLCLDAR
ncbi:hypothetical protein H9Q74_013685 [Fusarium xylarioides]|nr:hypothetical protein H9Q74_013685 [Fusarium xylarioides]